MPTREEMIKEVVDDYEKEHAPHTHDASEFDMRLKMYAEVSEIKALLEKIVEKMG
jgi:hypothetical protein